jgi:two-component system cell cycle response regulator
LGIRPTRPNEFPRSADRRFVENIPLERTNTAGINPTPLALAHDGAHTRVLAAEDNPVFQSMLRSMLIKWGYDPVIARDGAEALRALEAKDAPRLAILDWMMPGLDGVEICRRVRAAGREPYIYILLLTARTDSQDLVEGMDAGADDYLTKPFVAHELRVRLRAGKRILDLQSELMATREALRIQATHDNLTGISNRGAILDSLQTELSRAARERRPVAVLMADADRFKQLNDTRGHQAGDAVLHEVAHRMKSVMRQYDTVGRYGGEEFLVVLPGCDGNRALVQAERIREAISAEPFRAQGNAFGITCSLGCSWREIASPEDAHALIREADLALYQAKAHGRNRVESYIPLLVGAELAL